MPQKS